MAQPLLIERGFNLGRNDRIYPNSVRQQFNRPFAREGENGALRCDISGSATLARNRCFRGNVDHGPGSFFEVWQSKMGHVVVMKQIALEGTCVSGRRSIFESNAIVHACVIDQGVEAAKLFDSLSDAAFASFNLGQLPLNEVASR